MNNLDAVDWNNKGYSLDGQGRHDEAIEAYDRAIDLDPLNPIFHKNKAKALSQKKRRKNTDLSQLGSEEVPDPKRTSKSDYAIYWNNHAGALFKEGRVDEAILAYDRAISLDPTHPIFWKNKAKALKTIDRNAEAESAQELSESIASTVKPTQNERAINWNNTGYSLAEQGKHDEAIDAYNLAITKDPNFADAWNNKGYSLAELGNIEEAITSCYRAVELNPEYAYPWIERWLFLPELVHKLEDVPSDFHIIKYEAEKISSNFSGRNCVHPSGPIRMMRVFVHKENDSEKFCEFGWVCPDCGHFEKD